MDNTTQSFPLIQLIDFNPLDIHYYSYLWGFIASCLSVIGVLFILVCYLLFTEVRKKFFYFMVLQIGIGNLAVAISGPYLTNPSNLASELCSLVGVLKSFGLISSAIWTATIAWIVYYSLRYHKSNEELNPMKIPFIITVNLVAAGISFLPLIHGDYGVGLGIYCWLKYDPSISIFSLIMFELFLPFTVSGLICVYCYTKTALILKEIAIFHKKRDIYLLFIYPIVLVLCNVGSLMSVFAAYFNATENTTLTLLSDVTRQSQGFLNAIAFASTTIFRDEFMRRIYPNKNEISTNDEALGDKIPKRISIAEYRHVFKLNQEMEY